MLQISCLGFTAWELFLLCFLLITKGYRTFIFILWQHIKACWSIFLYYLLIFIDYLSVGLALTTVQVNEDSASILIRLNFLFAIRSIQMERVLWKISLFLEGLLTGFLGILWWVASIFRDEKGWTNFWGPLVKHRSLIFFVVIYAIFRFLSLILNTHHRSVYVLNLIFLHF